MSIYLKIKSSVGNSLKFYFIGTISSTLLFIIFLFSTFACKKKVITYSPMLNIEKEITLPVDLPVKQISISGNDQEKIFVGFDTNFIYYTLDNAVSWSKITFNTTGKCKGIYLDDSNNGVCLIGNQVYYSTNGGINWTASFNADFVLDSYPYLYAGKYTNGKCEIYISNNQGKNFNPLCSITCDGFPIATYSNGNDLIITGENALKTGKFYSVNLDDFTQSEHLIDKPESNTKINSIASLYSNSSLLIGSNGLIMENNDGVSTRTYYENTNEFYDCHYFGEYFICVGEKGIVSNLSMESGYKVKPAWKQVVDEFGDIISKNYYCISLAGNYDNSFVLGGDHGILTFAQLYNK